jgi:hypothetical protein
MDNPTEAEAQATVIRWRDMMVAAGEHRLALLHGDASGVRVGIGAAMKMKRQGAVKGWPDLMLPVVKRDSGGVLYHGLFIELKRRRGGVVSLEQVIVQTWLRAEGYCVHVCKGADEAIKCIKGYLGI